MSSLFPENPEHQPVPTSFLDFRQTIALGTVAVVIYGNCPLFEDHNSHGPHQEAPDGSPYPVQPFSAVGSTSGATPLTWQNGSMFDAANVVIQRSRALRDGQTRLAGRSSTDSSWLLRG